MNLDRFQIVVGRWQKKTPVQFLRIPIAAGPTLSAFPAALFLNSEFWHRAVARNWEDLLMFSPRHFRVAEDGAAALFAQRDALLEGQAHSRSEWQAERNYFDNSLSALRGYLIALHRHRAVRILV